MTKKPIFEHGLWKSHMIDWNLSPLFRIYRYYYSILAVTDLPQLRTEQFKKLLPLSHNYVNFCRKNVRWRAVVILRGWSKYIKNANFFAESNGYIANFWKRWNRAAIWFLLKRCFPCRIEYHRYRSLDEKNWHANQTYDTFYPFCILRSVTSTWSRPDGQPQDS